MANQNIARVRAPKAPNLPIPTISYSQTYFESLTNVMRLYFNELDKVFKYSIDPNIGQFLNFPFLAALDTTTQPATVASTAYAVSFNSPYLPSTYAGPNDTSPYLDPTDASMIVIPNSHYYNFSYTLNIVKAAAGAATVSVWLRLNSVNYGVIDFPNSTRTFTVPGGGVSITASSTIMTDEENGDSWQIMWSASTTGITLAPIAAVSPAPTGASAILAISYVSA
jgi:hypothetical protein